MKKLLSAVMMLSLAGCATGGAKNSALKAQFEAGIPTCAGEAQCKAAWEAAQVWVAQNSRMKIQTATDVLIETYGPGPYEVWLGMRVLKEPQGGGVYRLKFSGGCNNMFGCQPNPYEAGIQFNQAIARALAQ